MRKKFVHGFHCQITQPLPGGFLFEPAGDGWDIGGQTRAVLILGIDDDAVVDEDEEVVLFVAGDIGHGGFAGFGDGVGGAAEGMLLKDLPSVARDELAILAEEDDIEIILGRFHEDDLFAAGAGEVAGDDIGQETVLDGCVVVIQLGQVPDVVGEGLPGDGILSKEGNAGGAEGDGLDGGEGGNRQIHAFDHLPDAGFVGFAEG